jgi:hypothetical protein
MEDELARAKPASKAVRSLRGLGIVTSIFRLSEDVAHRKTGKPRALWTLERPLGSWVGPPLIALRRLAF